MGITHLVALLEDNAPSFCYYETGSNDKPRSMPYHVLRKLAGFARDNGLLINFVYGQKRLTVRHEALISTTEHVKIVPLPLLGDHPGAILSLDSNERELFPLLPARLGNVILRLRREHLPEGADIVRRLMGKFKKLSIYPVAVNDYNDSELEAYRQQLDILATLAISEYRQGSYPEINVFSDRMVLTRMNNCDAGVQHITVAPDGKLYLCPGFYYRDRQEAVGDLATGLAIKNRQLLSMECAPVCRTCDAYHCKRCVFLNLQSTGELNTPSRQQCVATHSERNKARDMLADLQASGLFGELPAIPRLDYLDPFQLVTGKVKKLGESPPVPSVEVGREDREVIGLLRKIYDTQVEILQLLKEKRI